ncbi:homing endonuclease associated repeat-containing protein [Halorussus pelagicus]|uniref:homing endonuclease associated repeat-containing protein n=1 Tax=Halorussus pelagicus TaxID=2505977 RepID=UPI00140D4B35|nr:hypothetical protein [Halorussus pelagicus]
MKRGVSHPNAGHSRTSRQDLLDELKYFLNDLNHTSMFEDMNTHGKHTLTYRNRFDSQNNAIKQAGLEPDQEAPTTRSERERKQRLLENLVELAEDFGHIPTQENP